MNTLTFEAARTLLAEDKNDDENNHIGLAFGLVFAAGLCTVLGSLLAYFVAVENTKVLAASLGASAGVMLYISFVEIFAIKANDAFMEHGFGKGQSSLYSALSFFGGITVIWILDKGVHLISEFQQDSNMQQAQDRDGKQGKGVGVQDSSMQLNQMDSIQHGEQAPVGEARLDMPNELKSTSSPKYLESSSEYGSDKLDNLQASQLSSQQGVGPQSGMEYASSVTPLQLEIQEPYQALFGVNGEIGIMMMMIIYIECLISTSKQLFLTCQRGWLQLYVKINCNISRIASVVYNDDLQQIVNQQWHSFKTQGTATHLQLCHHLQDFGFVTYNKRAYDCYLVMLVNLMLNFPKSTNIVRQIAVYLCVCLFATNDSSFHKWTRIHRLGVLFSSVSND